MRMAIDAMGGDHAPDVIVRGCLDALPVLEADDELLLIGDLREIEELLEERGQSGSRRDPRLRIVPTTQVISMDDSPVEAVRTKKDSSIVRMAQLGSTRGDRPCDFVLSAGNTGACVSAATMHMKRLPGVHRPGIAVTIPAFHGPLVLCDAGANPEPRAAHLWQYALMSEAYAQRVLKIERPRVAQLNIGSEEGKGTELINQVHDLLKATPDCRYIGFIEGRDLFDGVADVVVTDGFVGNTLLKMAEGLARSLFKAMGQEIFRRSPDLGLQLEPILRDIHKKNDYHEYGGAPLLGVNGVCIIAHGSSQARTITAAIRNSRAYAASAVNPAIVERIRLTAHVLSSHTNDGDTPAAPGSE